jgi:pyruvyltransferase
MDANFGDHLTEFILSDCFRLNYNPSKICGIGSILQTIPDGFDGKIWSSGFIYPTKVSRNQPLAVRGNLSLKHVIGDTAHVAIGDGGLVVSKIYQPTIKKKYKLGVVPHYVDILNMKLDPIEKYPIFQDPNVLFINPMKHPKEVIDQICSCENIISSSLHGLVISDSYNIPNCLFVSRESLLAMHVRQGVFKFRDYYSAFGQEHRASSDFYFNKNHTIQDCMSRCSNVDKIVLSKMQDQLMAKLCEVILYIQQTK